MATILSFTHSQSGTPFTPVPNFIEQARACEQIVNMLAESVEPVQRQALSHKLYARFAQLQPGLLDPIPECLLDHFAADTLPANPPRFEPDCTDLCRYCMALSAVLGEREEAGKTENALRDLLCELIDYFVAEIMAPRWVRETAIKFV